MSQRESSCSSIKNFQFVRLLLCGTRSLPFHYGYCWSHEHPHQERHNHSESCITITVSWRTQRARIHLANEGAAPSFFSTHLGHFIIGNVGNEFWVMLSEKYLKKQNLLTTLSAYTLPWYAQTWLSTKLFATTRPHCCVAFLSIKAWNIIATGQYIDYQTFSSLQFRPLLKHSFQSIHNDLRETSGEKQHLYL